jgi:hypothetical protein
MYNHVGITAYGIEVCCPKQGDIAWMVGCIVPWARL